MLSRGSKSFLDTDEGREYRELFWQLRLVYVANHFLDMDMLGNDNIIPASWIQPAITKQWYNMLRITQFKDTGYARSAVSVIHSAALVSPRVSP